MGPVPGEGSGPEFPLEGSAGPPPRNDCDPDTRLMGEYLGPLFAIVAGVLFVAVTLLVSSLVRPSLPLATKAQAYECGENPVGTPWGVQFNIRFYVFALVFLIFDVEAVVLLPWALAYLEMGTGALVAGLLFIGMLVLGLADVWVKGDLEWVRREDRQALKARSAAPPAATRGKAPSGLPA